jgi:hypothetical protein
MRAIQLTLVNLDACMLVRRIFLLPEQVQAVYDVDVRGAAKTGVMLKGQEGHVIVHENAEAVRKLIWPETN